MPPWFPPRLSSLALPCRAPDQHEAVLLPWKYDRGQHLDAILTTGREEHATDERLDVSLEMNACYSRNTLKLSGSHTVWLGFEHSSSSRLLVVGQLPN